MLPNQSAMPEIVDSRDSATVEEDQQVISPWEVSSKHGGKIDYDKVIDRFGFQRIDETLVERVERLTGRPAHAFLCRGIFFAHR